MIRQGGLCTRLIFSLALEAVILGCNAKSRDSAMLGNAGGAAGMGGTGGANTPSISTSGAGEGGATTARQTASSNPAACVHGLITFKLSVAAGSAVAYSAFPGGLDCEGAESWLSFHSADIPGRALPYSSIYGSCIQDCDSCDERRPCPALCTLPEPIGPDGVQERFIGGYVTFEPCAYAGCARSQCLPTGNYVAQLCGYPSLSGTGYHQFSATGTCFTVPFTWPPAQDNQIIERVLGIPAPGDASAALDAQIDTNDADAH
jgi:hypothetical protein